MLICIKCEGIIANQIPQIHYGCCHKCSPSSLTPQEKRIIAESNKILKKVLHPTISERRANSH
jgi:hypothetical protein